MKKGLLITLGVIVVLVFILYRLFAGTYNEMVDKEETVAQSWANVEAQYQRRADLIPNLVNTVKGFAEQEKEVLTGVVEARSKASSIQIDPSNLDAAQIQQFQQAQGQLSGALSRLLVTVERYPDLKSNQNFLDLQAQLEGTENRITVARNRFNEAATEYNKLIRSFPANIFAGMYGFERKPLFESKEGAERAPEVSF
ncbi:LemA family protein [Fulvivirga sp. RKSG066]|uniref:LemA family protein n=1 Tax=Fulvivirga aurantia TaxID=2529383 RepID=UPI0012BD54CC|nr:LemA family protein [Fulvivirga aurantia]MTI21551.1 LemA family protein [Fulvivirga aurantia]